MDGYTKPTHSVFIIIRVRVHAPYCTRILHQHSLFLMERRPSRRGPLPWKHSTHCLRTHTRRTLFAHTPVGRRTRAAVVVAPSLERGGIIALDRRNHVRYHRSLRASRQDRRRHHRQGRQRQVHDDLAPARQQVRERARATGRERNPKKRRARIARPVVKKGSSRGARGRRDARDE